jgi:thiamine biosynthesis protein ThiS
MVNHTTETFEILLNGESRRVPAGLTVLGLLQYLELSPERVAVELNRTIVRQPAWNSTGIDSGARIEIVQFVGGG